MKNYNDVYPKVKEDLIGAYYRCPWNKCNKKIKITEDGIYHGGNKHMIKLSLEELFQNRLYSINSTMKIFFGEDYKEKDEPT